MENDDPSKELACRTPVLQDLCNLCRELNSRGAKYLVIGGFAMRAAQYDRSTGDIDLMISSDVENETKVFAALSSLPDNAVKELEAGDVKKFNVVRIADEILIDLLHSAGGIDYEEASKSIDIHNVDGVSIPFASPRLLWRFKRVTHREKDFDDLLYLKHWFEQRGEKPPE